MIGNQVYLNAFVSPSEYSLSNYGFSELETSEYIYDCCDVVALYFLKWD
jgi:hypothetical protein